MTGHGADEEPCPTCGGEGWTSTRRSLIDGRRITSKCPDCDGEGTMTAYKRNRQHRDVGP